MVIVKVENGSVEVAAVPDSFTESVRVGVGDQVEEIPTGESRTFQT
jgi:translation initiation factor IF-1